jgi:hypothetical protein
MSVLEVPRLYFRGEVTWDPIVTNNDPSTYNEDTGQTVFQAAADKVQAFRQSALDAVANGGGNWNPHGTHRAAFYDSAVSGVDLGAGVSTGDPFVKAAVQFNGMLVDLEPFGAFSSQLFFNTMTFGVAGGYRILAPRTARTTARYINFSRNPTNDMIAGVASVIWQTSFAKTDGLRVDAFDSPALQALSQALEAHDILGLTVQFNVYRTVYFDDPRLSNNSDATQQAANNLQAKLNAGGFQPNPARSVLVGVVGLWRQGEPMHEPGDRVLLPVAASQLATSYVRLATDSLTIDLSNAVREQDRNLTKTDLGPLTVVAVDTAGQAPKTLGTLTYAQYNREAYEAASGIVSVKLTSALATFAADKDIQIRDSKGTVLLAERAWRAIPLTPNLYLDEAATATANFQLYNRGKRAVGSVPVTLCTLNADGNTIEKRDLTTDVNGLLLVSVVHTVPGIFAYVPCPHGVDLPSIRGINPLVNTYMYVRTRPADSNVGALPPTWTNVYTRVLANWQAMAPCMDNWLKLDDPVQVRGFATLIKRLTDPANFEDVRFMPVTRDMSLGERVLLYSFLDAPRPEAAPTSTAIATELPDFSALSRAMRGGHR